MYHRGIETPYSLGGSNHETTFNCTIEELKPDCFMCWYSHGNAFNCTIEELKHHHFKRNFLPELAFNCTIEELKLLYNERFTFNKFLLIVPSRNWNIHYWWNDWFLHSFNCTIEELKLSKIVDDALTLDQLLIVPSRNWNKPSKVSGRFRLSLLIVPSRNWNILFEAATSVV